MSFAEVPRRLGPLLRELRDRWRRVQPVPKPLESLPLSSATNSALPDDAFELQQAAALKEMLDEMKAHGATIQQNGSHEIPLIVEIHSNHKSPVD